jgi:hypothetical protein
MPRGWYLAALLVARSLASMLHGAKWLNVSFGTSPQFLVLYRRRDQSKVMVEATSTSNGWNYDEKSRRVYSVRKLARSTYNGWLS